MKKNTEAIEAVEAANKIENCVLGKSDIPFDNGSNHSKQKNNSKEE